MKATEQEQAVAALSVDHGLLSPADTVRLIFTARKSGRPLSEALTRHVPDSAVLSAIAEELGYRFVDLSEEGQWEVDRRAADRAGAGLLKDRSAIPVWLASGETVLVAAAPENVSDVHERVTSAVGSPVPVVLGSEIEIQTALRTLPPDGGTHHRPERVAASGGALPSQVRNSPVVDWVDNLLRRAAQEGASDLQFLCGPADSLAVRKRVDGTWRPEDMPMNGREKEIVGALMSKCPTVDPSDKTRPQDGTFSFRGPGGWDVDVRLAMLPQAYGPTIVCRLLDPENVNRRLETMGFASYSLAQMRRVVAKPQGAVFFIGPTGSGKTTTLYGLLQEQDSVSKNILTVEDPVEYRMSSIGQTQVRGDLGDKSLTFGKALRSILRLAPDVILIGEVRDPETAETAMHAALTGHMVLSTLHAKSAVGVYDRLAELGVARYLASESVSMAVAQRLVRRVHVCAKHGAPEVHEVDFLQRHNLPIPETVPHPSAGGCDGCEGTGYKGRLVAADVFEPTLEIRDLVASGAPPEAIRAAASADHTSLLADAFRHLVNGRTSIDELRRCAGTEGAN